MKKKLTVTVDAEVLPIAKQYARAKGVSLSSLIERSLRLMAAGGDAFVRLALAWPITGGAG